MITSDERTKVMAAIAKVQNDVRSVTKDKQNPFLKNKYVSIDAILDAIRDSYLTHGLVVTQWPDGDALITDVCHTDSGEFMRSSITILPKEAGAQAQGGALTYMRRYSLVAIFMLATDEDDDGETADGRGATTKKPAPVKNVARVADKVVAAKECNELRKHITKALTVKDPDEAYQVILGLHKEYKQRMSVWPDEVNKDAVDAFKAARAKLKD